jgi:hypothetical protein
LLLVIATAAILAAPANGALVPVVNTNNDSPGSLRQAIIEAAPGDTIVFQIPPSDLNYNSVTQVFTITLTSTELLIGKDLTIDGRSQKILVTRSGTAQVRLFNIAAGAVTIANITIAEGFPSTGGGGGIRNASSLLVRGCTLHDNYGVDQGGAIYNAAGATLTVENCTLVGNRLRATSDFGGVGAGIYNLGSLIVRDSTVYGNSAIAAQGKNLGASGGGIFNANTGTARVLNTILFANVARFGWNASGTFISDGYNILGLPTDGSTGFGATGDQTGVNSAQVGLGQLEDNGGPTRTMRPQAGSVAIDKGKRGVAANNLPVNSDQRGSPRPIDLAIANAVDGDGSDIGAVETGALQSGPAFIVTNAANHDDSFCSTDDCTLHEAISAAEADADPSTIVFAPGVGGIIDFSAGGRFIGDPVNIVGPGARQLAISGGNLARLFVIGSTEVAISGLTLTNARVVDDDGAAILNSGALTLTDCTIRSSSVVNGGGGGGNGGGLYNSSGATVVLTGCTFTANSASQFGGGAVFNVGTLTATNCTFYGNIAPRGGGILSVSDNGNSLVTLQNCTIANNTATSAATSTDGGGGYYGEGAVGNSLHHFSNTILAGNFNNSNPDLRGFGTSEGNNLVGNLGQSGSGFSNGVNGDKVGVAADFAAFGNNGGPTDTWSLFASSPAIDAGNDALALARDQRHFSRAGTSDIGAFEVNGVPPAPVSLVSVVSRKTHSGAGEFDVNLPLGDSPGVECRSGGASGNHTVLFTFANPLASVTGAGITSGIGNVSSSGIGTDANQYVVNLTEVANAQEITVTLTDVTDSLGNNSASVQGRMGLLVGDTTANRSVNASDVGQTKAQSGQPVTASNFRTDVNANGSINASDIGLVKARSGTALP